MSCFVKNTGVTKNSIYLQVQTKGVPSHVESGGEPPQSNVFPHVSPISQLFKVSSVHGTEKKWCNTYQKTKTHSIRREGLLCELSIKNSFQL